MNTLLLRWIINAVALWVAMQLVPGIRAPNDVVTLAATAAIFGLVNALIRPVLKLVTCPLILLTLGLFTLVINALMLWLTSWIAGFFDLGFAVDGFVAAVLGAVVVSVVSVVLSWFVRREERAWR
ncbi:MAG: hypothetical protein MAG451_00430 [Anaerolineales bacterium]|nr:hypothetical protein [Anaerolineales bacterium]